MYSFMHSLFFFILSATCFGCYLHPSSGAQLQCTATGVYGFGMLVHWSRYWLGHLTLLAQSISDCTSSWTLNWTYMLPRCTEPWTSNTDSYLIFCWSSIIVYQYNETDVMHFSFSLLRIKGLYVIQALLAHPQKARHKHHLVYSICVSVGCGMDATVPHSTDIICMQYTKCHFCSNSRGQARNVQNM
jgi:hypothetical protein